MGVTTKLVTAALVEQERQTMATDGELPKEELKKEEESSESEEEEEITGSLLPQDLAKLDVAALTPLTPEVISRQATINVGTIGHVAHGKSTVVKGISGVQTVRFKSELERNITIKLGYANAKVFKCRDPECFRPDAYCTYGSDKPDDSPC